VETPVAALPMYSVARTQVTFNGIQPENGDTIQHRYYNGPNSNTATLIATISRVFQQACLVKIGFEPANVEWCGLDYCSYPMRLGAINGPNVTEFAEVEAFIGQRYGFNNLTINSYNGCWDSLESPNYVKRFNLVEHIRTGIVREFFTFSITTTATGTILLPFTNGGNNLDVNWGDGSITEKYTTAASITKTYAFVGTYEVEIAGWTNAFIRQSLGTTDKIRRIHQMGKVVLDRIRLTHDVTGADDFYLEDLYWSSTTLTSMREFMVSTVLKRRMNTTFWYLPNV
jgi:hypothetical protein